MKKKRESHLLAQPSQPDLLLPPPFPGLPCLARPTRWLPRVARFASPPAQPARPRPARPSSPEAAASLALSFSLSLRAWTHSSAASSTFLPRRSPSFFCPAMARHRWKATGARLEGAEPALLPFLPRHSRPPIKAEPPLCPSPSPARCREPPPPANPSARALNSTPTCPGDLPRPTEAVGTSTSRFWPRFPRIQPQPRPLSLSLQFTAAVDDSLWSPSRRRDHHHRTRGEFLRLPMLFVPQMAA